ncbi:MAG: prepilin-type N-terminal cleavage/methylation domain-containing protein [Deltaproteobacteria bacterium]|nr:prepilin-type N-terminal cleavage/methylation domain-containing protein [Deltaproteobacteria bacterium]
MRSDKGMTLIEVMVALAVAAMTLLVVIPNYNASYKVNLKSASRTLSGVFRYIYNGAIARNHVYRVVFDLDRELYWVESSSQTLISSTMESPENGKKEEGAPPPSFQKDDSKLGKETSLPRGVEFESIERSSSKEPITSGKVFVHAFPHGFVEQVAIHLIDAGDHEMTIINRPLMGSTKIYAQRQSLPHPEK